MKRGHICVARGFSKRDQETILAKAKVNVIYVDEIGNAIMSTRKGEGLYVAGLTGLATSKKGIKTIIRILHAKGAFAVDAATGRKSNGADGVDLMAEAAGDLERHALGGWQEQEDAGRKGGLTYAKNLDNKRAPLATLRAFWFDTRMTAAEAIEKANSLGHERKWLERAAYSRLGPRIARVAVTQPKE